MRWLLVALIGSGTLFIASRIVWVSRSDRLLRDASLALVQHDFSTALKLSQQVLANHGESGRACLIAGEALAAQQNSAAALEYFRRVPEDRGEESLRALFSAGMRYLRTAQLAQAERCFRRTLELDPEHVEALTQLVDLLHLEGRSSEAMPFHLRRVRAGTSTGDDLVQLASSELVNIYDPELLKESLAKYPEDTHPCLAQARLAIVANDEPKAVELLRRVIAVYPEDMEAQARLGRLLLQSDDEFRIWRANVPSNWSDHPEIWFTDGMWALQHGQKNASLRCFWETVRRNPNHLAANHQMAVALAGRQQVTASQAFAKRARELDRLAYLLSDVSSGFEYVKEMCELFESLDRHWEAAAWYARTQTARPDLAWTIEGLRRTERKLIGLQEMTSPEGWLWKLVDLSREPLPDWNAATGTRSIDSAQRKHSVRFTDVAQKLGINFQYYNGADPASGRAYMFEYSGGGVGVIDYDGDGWADMHLTQGCPWPLRADQQEYRDRLFRNVNGQAFQDITELAGVGDNGMSHGVTVGDYDADGFADLFVGNIGENRLYHNNGDGTFSDLTQESGTASKQWTTSCAMADLNADALPDLYVVTYLAGPEVFEHQCERNRKPVQCGPTIFPAEQDRLFLNLGDGRFRDISDDAGILAPDGKGLGIVVADFEGTNRLDLFIANDTTANFYFANQTGQGGSPRFSEEALARGVACDELGRNQSCMGVAVDDANGDSRLDLFVTNFAREANALYRQQSDGTFLDDIRKSALHDPGYDNMGWGTQFLDGELDGHPDLVVANGHINDFRDLGIEYQMRPQYFHNLGQNQTNRFVEGDPGTLGTYFQSMFLGRALAILDWNRDGLMDFCTTHVDSPFALLANQTEQHGHFITLQLRGVESARDAIGTTVQVRCGEQEWSKQLTAGDGFYVSNHRVLNFGLGECQRIDELKISWPSGRVQTFLNLPVDKEWMARERAAELFELFK